MTTREGLLALKQKLLVAIVNGDWQTYELLCDPSLTCFEPESRGQLVAGMPFPKCDFDLPAPRQPARNVTMSQPRVRMLAEDAAVISYVRLTQSVAAAGRPLTACEMKTFRRKKLWPAARVTQETFFLTRNVSVAHGPRMWRLVLTGRDDG